MISNNRNLLQIKVKTIDGNVTQIEAMTNDTVQTLKEKIRNVINIPVSQQKLIYQAKVMKDNDTISAYNIEDNVVIHLVKIEPSQRRDNHSSSITSSSNDINSGRGILSYLSMLSMLNNAINPFSFINAVSSRDNNSNINNNTNSDSAIQISDSFMHLITRNTFDLYSSIENIEQNINNVNLLISSKSKITKIIDKLYTTSNTYHNKQISFQLGQWVDVLDQFMQWSEAQIISFGEDDRALVHFLGHSSNLDEWISLSSPRLALYRTHTIQSPFNKFYSPFPNKPDSTSTLSLGRVEDPLSKINDIKKLIGVLVDKMEEVNHKREEIIKDKDKGIGERGEKEKEAYMYIMQIVPLMDRVGRLLTDYSMLLMNLSFGYFENNYQSFSCEDDSTRRPYYTENDQRDFLRKKVSKFEQLCQIGAMRTNGEVARAYRITTSPTYTINTGQGANFQRQLRNNNNSFIANSSVLTNNTFAPPRRIIVNQRGNRIDYLNQIMITPSQNIQRKFPLNKTKVIHLEQFSLCHYNKVRVRTFENFTQTFPIISRYNISHYVSQYEFIPRPKKNISNSNNIQIRTSSKIVIDANKPESRSIIQNKKKINIISNTKKRLKLLK